MTRVIGDLEANGLLRDADTIWCGVFEDLDTGEEYIFEPDTIHELPEFLDTVDLLCMHNGVGYDKLLLEKVLGYEYKGKLFDTLIVSRLQDPKRAPVRGCKGGPHSVEAWGMRFGRPKPDHEDWSQYSPEMLHRCREDVAIQKLVLRALLDEGKSYDWQQARRTSFEVFEILARQEQYGWLFDIQKAAKYQRLLSHWMRKIDNATYSHLPMLCVRPKKVKGVYSFYRAPFKKYGSLQNYVQKYVDSCGGLLDPSCIAGPFSVTEFRHVRIDKAMEIKDFLLSEGWEPKEWNTDDDGNHTSPKLSVTDPFDGVGGQLGKLAAKWIQCRHRRSQITGWFKSLREDGRISQVITGIASTGRLKHSGIVNVPGDEAFFGKPMRSCFTCKPGYKVVGVDSAGCQNRMLAARVGDPDYTKTLLDGRKEDRTSIHYVNQDAIATLSGAVVPYKVCKNLNYAFLFGATDNKLYQTSGRAVSGEVIREALYSVAPGLEAVIRGLTEEWKKSAKPVRGKFGISLGDGFVTGLDGRPILISQEHCLLVYTLQSDEALLMQRALVLLFRRLNDKGWKHGVEYGFVANVHDEFQAEVREDLAEEYAEVACWSIEQAGRDLGIACEHKGEYDIGNSWAETH